MRIRVSILAALALAPLTTVGGPAQQDKHAPPRLAARITVEEHEHSFTVRLYLRNDGREDVQVMYGRGGEGMRNVPQLAVGGLSITPPTYLRPVRRSLRPDTMTVPAGKEVLYGTFTQGYPPRQGLGRDDKLVASISFPELRVSVQAPAVRLTLPKPVQK
jgi:hypothetical protein